MKIPYTGRRNFALIRTKIYVVPLLLLIMVLETGCNRNSTVKWEELRTGVWRIEAGTPEKTDLLSELDIRPNWAAIEKLPVGKIPFGKDDIRIEFTDGKTYLKFPLEQEEKIFGLGLNFQTVEQRGRIMRLHMDHYNGVDNGRSHAPVPFFVSSRGYGVLINSARYIDIWVGTGVERDSPNAPAEQNRNTDVDWDPQPYSDNISVLVPAAGVELLVFTAENMLDVVRKYNLYQGGGFIPPRWGLGFWQRTPTLFSDQDVLEEIEGFREHDFPLSVIGLEPGWQTNAYPCTFEWDSVRYPEPADFIKGLSDDHIYVNLWMNPYVSKKSELYGPIHPYTADHTVWNGIIPDFTIPEARELAVAHFKKNQLDLGVSGYKMDETDGVDVWLWPDVTRFPSGNTAEQMRSIYGSLMESMTTDMYRSQNKRTYGLTRAANAGTVSYPYVLYNDYYNHQDFITALINSSFIGVLWTPEVRASHSAEEWVRRMQTVSVSPMCLLNAWADGTKPWSFPEVTGTVREIAKFRMQLIPYLYTAFAAYHFEGTPLVRAMNLEPGFGHNQTRHTRGELDATDNPYEMATREEIKDQFMVGESLLVAPLFAGQTSREVVLPEGKWYDFYTGQLVGEGEVITVTPGLEKMPLFVKDGGIIPLWPALNRVDGKAHPVEIRHYGAKPGKYLLYDDDGETYDYENGAYTFIALEVTGENGKLTGQVEFPTDAKTWSYSDFSFRFMTQTP